MYTFLAYSDLKSNFNYAIHTKTSWKIMVFSEFLPTLFFIFWGLNSKKVKQGEILHFEKHSFLCNRFEKRTMFFVFSFFHFLCKFRIQTGPLSVTKTDQFFKFSISEDVIYCQMTCCCNNWCTGVMFFQMQNFPLFDFLRI